MSGKHLKKKSISRGRTPEATAEIRPPKTPEEPKPRRAKSGRSATSETRPNYLKTAAKLIAGLLVAALLILNLFTHVFSIVSYYGDSMEPTLSGGKTLIILKTAKIEEGDIVAFYYNNKVIVRRVVCGGDKQISISEEGVVSINGEVIMEDYVSELSLGQCDISFPYSIPSGRFFVMGDNRLESMDSRLEIIGAISPDRIIGKIIFVK